MEADTVIYVGIDIGSVGIKAAAVGMPSSPSVSNDAKSFPANSFYFADGVNGTPVLLSKYRRILADPARATLDLLNLLAERIPLEEIGGICFTGGGGQSLARLLNLRFNNELNSLVRGVRARYPEALTIIEMGGNSSRYIRLQPGGNGFSGILDYETNGDCAAGTGAFIDQQASRLQCRVEEIGRMALSVNSHPTIAGRCTVFSKTDMVHAQQRGYTPAQIVKGLCDAVVRNFKGTVAKGKLFSPPVIVAGGMAANAGIVQAVQNAFKLAADSVIVPSDHSWLSAIGAALAASDGGEEQFSGTDVSGCLEKLERALHRESCESESTAPLLMDNVLILRDEFKPYSFDNKPVPVRAYLGIDVGSVSTNFAVIDDSGALIHPIYMRTNSRPIETVREGLLQIQKELNGRIRIEGVGTTGSGRDLIGGLVGADAVHDEITAHKTGALFISRTMLDSDVDTILEIGGQDSKFIRLEKGIVVDFSMNEACSAGTGSFLEEQAERLGINIESEFARLALQAQKPTLLGERCTVFMEKDLLNHLHRGEETSNLSAGLAYSVALNYLNRVVHGRKIGNRIFFQGGLAYNDSVAAAFGRLLQKTIVVPPHNGVIGAIGAALLARRKMEKTGNETSFHGYDLDTVDYELREHICSGCSNNCTVQEMRVEDEKTYWGDKCATRFRRRPKTDRTALIEDLFARRTEWLQSADAAKSAGPRIGIPRCMYAYDSLPFWQTYFHSLGCSTVVSGNTHRKMAEQGIESAMAEPCFPVQVAHGHVLNLKEEALDYIFVPNLVHAWATPQAKPDFLCPWGQTLPFVLQSARALSEARERFLTPTIRFRDGLSGVQKALGTVAARLGYSQTKSNRAVRAAFQRQRAFAEELHSAGHEALECLKNNDRTGILLLARPYTLYDSGVNMDLPRKLRNIYGIDVIPMDFLDGARYGFREDSENMYWDYGRKIVQAARFADGSPYLQIIFMTNFRCGPDSFIRHDLENAVRDPFLVLQLDSHGSDAGTLTRCEAYLESKGFM